MNHAIYRDVQSLAPVIEEFKAKTAVTVSGRLSGVCGFDGFIDTFVRLLSPPSMAEFGPKVAAAAGVAASYPVRHLGDKFGGNGPLFVAALYDIYSGQIDATYIGAMGRGEVLPIFQAALGGKTKRLYTLAAAAQTTCLEFTDGKIMLNDMAACGEVTWQGLLASVGQTALDSELKVAAYISAVNWGKLPQVGAPAKLLGYEGVPNDHYLWLTGQAGRILRGEVVADIELYRNTSRESVKTAKK
ncbi:MAG: hypothetical protein MUF81_07130 [Verrucomicrobia bacterium]|nr:hypothetical protein [Verrucomicrobiota bacterium]